MKLLLSFFFVGALSGCTTYEVIPSTRAVKTVAPARSVREIQVRRDETYVVRPSGELKADLTMPVDDSVEAWPAILLVHGGGWNGGSRDDMDTIAEKLAQRGYVAVSISYRLAPEFPHPAALEDLREAVKWMRKESKRLRIDPTKIGALGYSAGAHLASLLAVDPKTPPESRVKAVSAGGSPMNLTWAVEHELVQGYLRGSGPALDFVRNPEVFRNASPVYLISQDSPPFFLYHGKIDRTVVYEHLVEFSQKLKEAGVPVETYSLCCLGHIAVFLLSDEAISRSADFFDRYVRDATS